MWQNIVEDRSQLGLQLLCNNQRLNLEDRASAVWSHNRKRHMDIRRIKKTSTLKSQIGFNKPNKFRIRGFEFKSQLNIKEL